MNTVLLVTTTFSSKEEAVNMAQIVIKRRLAACAQLSAECESYYWWKESIEQSYEYVLTMKTLESSYPKLLNFLESTHSYDTPEIVATPVSHLSPDYHKWIQDELRVR